MRLQGIMVRMLSRRVISQSDISSAQRPNNRHNLGTDFDSEQDDDYPQVQAFSDFRLQIIKLN